ncbi:Conserved_hypothetical protein [Hexamita inflata]|uniref:Uncharacterized protein n=1 Tax=Hexamita inflata TaxID=28002 RepID=A0AA86Q2N1_9EUKA|nr:Conserved hypothetical protein [Hexamita inflata]
MILATILAGSVSSSFSECFSSTSYMNGNPVTNQLSLRLRPFERLNQITDENLCKMYLPGKVVVVQLHYDDISFPRPGAAEVNFLYQFNQEIVVTFTLTPADYLKIVDKQNAMYELWYDVNLVKVNNSINTIEHTKYNGTGCFSSVTITYSIDTFGDIDLGVSANNCNVAMNADLQVYLEFQNGQSNSQIPIYPCTTGCSATEYKTTSTNFKAINLYKIKKTPVNADLLNTFYTRFIENRRIPIIFNVKFKKTNIYSVISRPMDKFVSKDIWNCKNNGTQTDSHLFIGSTINPDHAFIQFRESFTNRMFCDTKNAVMVRVDCNLFDLNTSFRATKLIPLHEFNNQIGIPFEMTPQLKLLRDNYNPLYTKRFVTVSYLDANNKILWELVSYSKAYVGCIKRATVHLYENRTCYIYDFDVNRICQSQKISATNLNSLGIFYTEKGITESLGYYKFKYAINYTDTHQEVCFVCDEFLVDKINSYARPTCKENQELTKQKLKTATVGFGMISTYESVILTSVVAEYDNIYLPLIVSGSAVLVLMIITTSVFIAKQTAQ